MRALLASVIAVSLLGVAGCEDTPTTPSPTTADLFFTSQLMAKGSVSRSFTTTRTGDVKVVFTSLLPEATALVSISLGTFDGTTCTPTTTVTVAQGSDPVITTSLGAGNYCIRIADSGGVLTKTNDFSITVSYPVGTN